MRITGLAFVALLIAAGALGQAALQPVADRPPTLDEARSGMDIPSQGDVRGQRDTVGFASTPAQMTRTWELSAEPPEPERFSPIPSPGVAAVICPHDDYLYAGRVYRKVLPLVTAKTVILVGVFHRYRHFGAHDVLVFDPYRAWRGPGGEIVVSSLREELLRQLPDGFAIQNAAMHDSEHSLEALAYWLQRANPDVQIVPIIVPTASFDRFQELAAGLGQALATIMHERGWSLGSDIALAISTDGVHYGSDFRHTPYGAGGVRAYIGATEQDISLLRGPLTGPVTSDKVRQLFTTFVDPEDPNQYRLTWCGRFSVPFGLLFLAETAAALELPSPVGHPVAYATSVGAPELPLQEVGLGATAPANLYHFVSYPAVAFTVR